MIESKKIKVWIVDGATFKKYSDAVRADEEARRDRAPRRLREIIAGWFEADDQRPEKIATAVLLEFDITPRQIGSKRGAAKPQKRVRPYYKFRDSISAILSDAGTPLTASEIYEAMVRSGAAFNSKDPKKYLSVILAGLSPDVYSLGYGAGWWLRSLGTPPARKSAEFLNGASHNEEGSAHA